MDSSIRVTLDDMGACVIDLNNSESVTQVTHDRVTRARINFIEYNLSEGSKLMAQHVLDSKGLLGNPSSFHHTGIRYLRLHCKKALVKILQPWLHDQRMSPDYRLEGLFDRLGVRTNYGAEGTRWKRDTYEPDQDSERLADLREGDIVLSGFLNCNVADSESAEQRVLVVPGSWKDYKLGDPAEVPEDFVEDYDMRRWELSVPPGSMLVMRHGLAYRELKTTRSRTCPDGPDYRLYLSYRLTLDTECLYEQQMEWMEKQAVPRIASGALPQMYGNKPRWADMHEWTVQMLRKECYEVRANGLAAPDKVMKSLAEYGLGMFPEYTQEDKDVMTPTRINAT